MPGQMLAYRAASFWSRMYAPDATMGMHTQEELEDVGEIEINPIPQRGESSTAERLKETIDKQTGEVIENEVQQTSGGPDKAADTEAAQPAGENGPDLALDD